MRSFATKINSAGAVYEGGGDAPKLHTSVLDYGAQRSVWRTRLVATTFMLNALLVGVCSNSESYVKCVKS